MAERQLEYVIASSVENLKPRTDARTILALLLSVAVLLTPVAIAGLGVFVILWSDFAVIGTIFGVCLLIMAWVLLPPVNRLDGPVYGRAEMPALFELVDKLAGQIGAPKVDGIWIDPSLNAFMGRFSRRRKRILGIGLTLWQILEHRERVALLAHELAHEVNGDPARTTLIWMAENTLHAWIDMLTPDGHDPDDFRSDDWGIGMAGEAMRIMAGLVTLLLRGLVRLNMRQSQIAEYYADLIAAKMAGYEAEVDSQRKLVLRPAIDGRLVRRISGQPGAGRKLLTEMKGHIDGLSAEAVEQLEKRMLAERSSVDATHPPTAYRLRFLSHHSDLKGEFDASTTDWAAIDAELDPFLEPMGQALLDEPWRL